MTTKEIEEVLVKDFKMPIDQTAIDMDDGVVGNEPPEAGPKDF